MLRAGVGMVVQGTPRTSHGPALLLASDNYVRDRAFGFGYHLNQNSPVMATLQTGDSLWAFTRRPGDNLYVLAAELLVRAVTRNVPHYRYGTYRAWGDLEVSRYFDIEAVGAANVEPLIRKLSVATGSPVLGRAFQGAAAVRTLTRRDHQLLATFSLGLPTFERVAFYPEDVIEAGLVYGGDVRELAVPEGVAEHNRRLHYLYETIRPIRARRHVLALQERYRGRCQICLYDPLETYGEQVCHAHHIQWLSRGGEDELSNLVLICPNHHAAIHQVDAPFDFADLAFDFLSGRKHRREPLQLNTHLQAAA
jgi:5-methylcytosine-specific restriction enzyme A